VVLVDTNTGFKNIRYYEGGKKYALLADF